MKVEQDIKKRLAGETLEEWKARVEELRIKAMEAADEEGKKAKFDLFSQPPPIVVGSNHFNIDHPPREDGKGEPIKGPRNILVNPQKKGKTQTVFLDSKVWAETENYPEPYHDPGKIQKMGRDPKKVKVRKKKKKKEGEEAEEEEEGGKASFFPAVTKWAKYQGVDEQKNAATRFGNPYPYFNPQSRVKKRKIKNKDGDVITKPRNIQSEPVRHGRFNSTYGHTINKYPEYKDEKRHLSKKGKLKNMDKWNKHYTDKMNGHFKSMGHPKTYINSHKAVYGGNPEKILPPRKSVRVRKIKKKNNEGDADNEKEAFKPSFFGCAWKHHTFDKFKRLIPPAPKRKMRIRKGKGENKREPFKPSRNYLSRPTPSVTLHRSNLRSCLR